MAAGDFVTAAEVKALLPSTDVKIDLWIPIIQSLIHEITGNTFITTGTTVFYPASLKLPVTRYISYLLGQPGYPANWTRGNVSTNANDEAFLKFKEELRPFCRAKII